VSGLVTPDTLTVRKRDGAILAREIAAKNLSVEYAPTGGTVEIEVPAERRSTPALSDVQVEQLRVLALKVEQHYGAAMDIEWAYANERFYILQARAITTLAKADASAVVRGRFSRAMFVEIFPDPLSPIFLSEMQMLFQSMLDFTFTTLGFKPPQGIQAVGAFYNQPYFNRDYVEAALAPLSPPVRARLVAQIVNPFGAQERGVHGELSRAYLGMTFRLLRFMLRFPSQLPRILDRYRAQVRAVGALDLQTMSDAQIVERLFDLAYGTGRALVDYDFLMIALIGVTYQMLGTLLLPSFGDETEAVRGTLVSGVTGNVTMETNKRLWDLAQQAKQSPRVSELLRRYGYPELRARLLQNEDGRAFVKSLDQFLSEFGHREVRMDILYPTWIEDPAPVLAFLRGYLDADEAQSPFRHQERLVQERETM
ncbi:MAG: hypothetical protein LC737_03925, partial [Chloroflexi bacterium]|nr:hypothetical protein [Chloroflexota bacterium]